MFSLSLSPNAGVFCTDFYVYAGDLNSGPHLTEQAHPPTNPASPQEVFVVKEQRKS